MQSTSGYWSLDLYWPGGSLPLICCRKILFILPLLLTLSVQAGVTEDGLPDYSLHYDIARDPFVDGEAAIKLAQASGRNILIEVGGNWCSWCHVLDRFFRSDPMLWDKLHQGFVVLKVNVGDGNDNAGFMSGMPPVHGYPHLFVARSNGSVIYSQSPAEFIRNGEYSAIDFMPFLDRWSRVGHESEITSAE